MNRFFFYILFAIILFFISVYVHSEVLPGKISGRVVDRSTRAAIPSANVIVTGERYGAAADLEGNFIIANLPPGLYHLQASALGYRTLTIHEIHVLPNRTTVVEFLLLPDAVQAEEVVVKAGVFNTTPDLPVSNRSLRYEEIRRAPGSAEDVQRMIQALPGVATENDQNNEIVVRGGSPYENLTVVDGIEIDNINHFGYEAGTGGPISALNPEFLKEVTFSSGGFSAKYGDRLSSVLAVDLREGDREHINGDLMFSMAGAGGYLEGPWSRGRGSYLVSARKSYLDLIHKQVGLTAIPHYWDTQSKVVYDLSPKHKLTINGLLAVDDVKIEDEEEGAYSRGAEGVDFYSTRYIVGARLRSLWGVGFSDLIIGRSWASFNADVFEVENRKKRLIMRHRNWEADDQIHLHWTARAFDHDEWSAGLSLKPISFIRDIWMVKDSTLYEDGTLYGKLDGEPDIFPSGTIVIEKERTSLKYGAYVQYTWRPRSHISLVAGLRYDGFDYPNKHTIGPRFSAQYYLLANLIISGAYGRYYQAHPMQIYTYDEKDGNRYLPYSRADQAVLGVTYFPRESSKLSLEGYYKDYKNLLISEEAMVNHFATIDTFRSNLFLPKRTKYAWGLELFAQQILTKQWYSTFSYSYGQSKAKDSVFQEFPADYDIRHILTLVLGYKFPMTHFRENEQKKWYWWWTLPLPINGDEVTVSSRIRYVSGRPYTSRIWTDAGPQLEYHWEDRLEVIHDDRYPAYSRWDVRLDDKWFFGGNAVVVFMEIENILDRPNVAQYIYADNGKRDTAYQFRFFFVGGMKYEW